MKICYIAIGSELLKGRIINTNLTKIGAFLREQGYDLNKALEIQDTKPAILQALHEELANHDLIIMSGGLGPTADDITKKTIAEFFGVEMYEHSPTVDRLRAMFEKRGRELTDRNRQQALVPTNCEVLTNKMGTAPGMLFRHEGKILISMPGVPFEMMYLLENEVLPILKKTFPTEYIQNHILRVWGIFESHLADKIAHIETQFPPEMNLSYLPRIDGIWLEFTIKGEESNKETLSKTLASFVAQIKTCISKYIYTEGKMPLEEEINHILRKQKRTLAIAESITGGAIVAKLVNISGASEYLKGSITAYYTEIKINVLGISADLIAEKGVASEEVAIAMAEGVRILLGADIGIATTGYSEAPQKGEQPYVCYGYADKNGTDSWRENFFYTRELNIQRATERALIGLIQKVK